MAIPLESLFANLGTSLGSGVAGGLENLAQLRLQQIAQDRMQKQTQQQQSQQAAAYQQAGLPTWLAALPQGQQDLLVKSFAEGGGFQALSQPQQEQALEMDQFTANQQAEQPTTQQPMSGLDFLNMLNQSKLQASQPAGLQQAALQSSAKPLQLQPKPVPAQVNQPARRDTFGEAVSRGLTSKERAAQRKQEFQEQQSINKAEKPVIDQIRNEYKTAKESSESLDRMLQLIEKGKLPSSGWYNLWDALEDKAVHAGTAGALGGAYLGGPFGAAVGGVIGSLISPIASLMKYAQKVSSPDAEEFEKLSNSFIKGAKTLFGNRITNDELKAFLKTIPTFNQTPSGKKAIIRNMKIFNDAAKIKYNTATDLIKKNNGKIPPNLGLLVDEIAQPKLDQLSKKFINAELSPGFVTRKVEDSRAGRTIF